MARPVIGVLALLLIAGLAQATTDPAGDVARRIGDPPVDEPAVDILAADATLADGTLDATITVAGDLPLEGNASDDLLYSYLFVVGLGAAPDDNLYQHIQSGDAITVTCDFHPGQYDLSCEVTGGDAALRGSGAVGRNVTLRLAVDWDAGIAIGAIAHKSIANETTGSRDILAQDFTDNALPYQNAPDGEDDGFVTGDQDSGSEAWWRTPWILVILAVVGIVAVYLWAGRKRE